MSKQNNALSSCCASKSHAPNLFHFPNLLGNLPEIWDDMLPDHSGLSVSEDEKNIYVEANMPGMDKDAIDIRLDQGVLIIRGDKEEKEENKDKTYYRRASSSYSYQVSLPSHIDEKGEPGATYKDGILKLTFSKNKNNQGKKIQIKNG